MESQPQFQHPQPQSHAPAIGQISTDVQPSSEQIADLQRRISDLESKRVVFNTGIIGLFEVVSAVPTGVPTSPYDQIKIYTNSTTYRLYWYDQVNHAWRFATGT